MKKRAAIYCITCLTNNRRYVGSSVNVAYRWREHRYHLNHRKHHSPALQHSWSKYGPDAFQFAILEVVSDPKTLIEREQHWIDLLRPEFNAGLIAFPTRLGATNGPDHRRKMAEGLRRHWASLNQEERQARAQALASSARSYWKSLTADERSAIIRKGLAGGQTRAKMSESAKRYAASHPGVHRGRKHSPEAIAKMRAATLAQWEKSRPEREAKRAAWEAGRASREMERRRKLSHANRGKTIPKATRRKLRAAANKQWADPAYRTKHAEATQAAMKDPEVLRRLSESHKGAKLTERQKRRIGKAHRGRKKSPETIAKMREARRLWWERKKASHD